MSKNSGSKEYKDILNYEPEPLRLVSDERTNSLLWDKRYYIIVRLLRTGSKTLSEIVEEYNGITRKGDTLERKSGSSIYRYVKKLEDAGLVAQAGRRVHFRKMATEILYSRTADIFQYRAFPLSAWRSERGRRFFERLFSAIKHVFPDHVPIKSCLSDFILRFERAKQVQVEATLGRIGVEALELVTGGHWWEIQEILAYSGIIGLMLNNSEMLTELARCFEKTG